MPLVSLTALRLKGWWHLPTFLYHATRSIRQAERTPGNISVAAQRVDGRWCTITVWRDAKAMRSFAYSGAHRGAIRAFPRIARGYIHSYEGEPPSWDGLLAIAESQGRAY